MVFSSVLFLDPKVFCHHESTALGTLQSLKACSRELKNNNWTSAANEATRKKKEER